MKNFKLPISLKIFIGLLVIGLVWSMIASVYIGFITTYNKTIDYAMEYNAVTQGQLTTWDNNYLSFNEKFNIADISKETFLTTTSIIMSARKDGANLAWKWSRENQQIPYEEFTVFYKELSNFIGSQFNENKAIELRKQNIVKQNNLLLTSFPGILYNKILKRPLMVYKEGFISSKTKTLFNKK